ncbi:MAG TPA: hypothetical protein VM940_11605 [Chthoniobacterales bacterium]|jgi:alpha-tubulin suppressor-like RCC1 family protein|nr:hypothetical protein [Chthoniobacterales bacterium]
MKRSTRPNCGSTPRRRLVVALLAAIAGPVLVWAAPSWWSERGVLTGVPGDDFAPINQGQLKNIARAASQEMDAKLSGGAGSAIHNLITAWTTHIPGSNDFAPVNLGQVKNVAKPFYDRLIELGLADVYPWQRSLSAPEDFTIANIGQVKNLFSFDVPTRNVLDDARADRLTGSGSSGNLVLHSYAVWIWGNRLSPLTNNFDRDYPRRLSGLAAVSSVGAGRHHFVVLHSNGAVSAWGENAFGQLGDGSFTDHSVPTLVPNVSDIVSVKAGSNHNLALKQEGTVLAWGRNSYGQIGSGDLNDRPEPTLVVGLDNVVKISAGSERSVALKTDGTVWAWGYDRYLHGHDVFNLTPIVIEGLDSVVEIAAGYEHTAVVKSDGSVWVWGANYYDQLGIGGTHYQFEVTPVQIPALSNISKIATGAFHTLALAADGTVWAWGYNFDGQLGDGTNQPRTTPVPVVGLSNVVAVATAESYSMALKADGTVWIWGDFAPGALGGTNLRVPQQVGLGLYDLNHNAIDDRWEMQFLGDLNQPGNGDLDGDGSSNLQEYLRGTDPRDYYNGTTPVIEIVSGNNQSGDPGTYLTRPFIVRVRSAQGQILVNAPVSFSISNSLGALTLSAGGAQETSVTSRTDSKGEARAYHFLPQGAGMSSRTVARAGSSEDSGAVTFRGIARFKPPPTPTATPDPNQTPTPTPDPGATVTPTPAPPFRYAIIDLGRDSYPVRINNQSTILLAGRDSNGEWGNFRWKGGVAERLTYSGPHDEILLADINDRADVVGYLRTYRWLNNKENELRAGLYWPAASSAGIKIPAPTPCRNFKAQKPGTFRFAQVNAITNSGLMFGESSTDSVNGFLFDAIKVLNAAVWTLATPSPAASPAASPTPSPTQLSNAQAVNEPVGSDISKWKNSSDSVLRANAQGHYIGKKFIPSPTMFGFLQGTETGMIDGEAVSFFPVDLNEGGLSVGNHSSGRAMVIRMPEPTPTPSPGGPSPSASPKMIELVFEGAKPLAINDHSIPIASPLMSVPTPGASPSPTATPQPTPIPAPQVLSWVENALVLWELQPDGKTWHPFGLEEMIPSMDGWQYLEAYDINDAGVIVGIGWYTDPADPKARGEYHAFMLAPIELMVDGNRDGEMSFDDPAVHAADATSEEKPYRFWVNDDDDGAPGDPGDHVPPSSPDYADGIIRSSRDLEDFARLHVNLRGLESGLQTNSVKAVFEWKQHTGAPKIKLYRALSAGSSYLTQESIAASAMLFPFKDALGEVGPGTPFIAPQDFWVGRPLVSSIPKTLPDAWFLFEGSGEGTGELIIGFWVGGRKVGETPGAWLDIKNIKRLFQRAKGTPLDGVAAPWSAENPLPTAYVDDPAGYEFAKPPDEDPELIIFVHGIHAPFSSVDASYRYNINTAETVFKRLWHNGYKGRFALFKWPALNPAGYFLNGTGFQFNQSEYRAFKYGKGLALFAESFPGDYKRHIYAHSQGNAVAAAAFRNYGLKAKTWLATQGAIPISCFDRDLRHNIFSYVTPDSAPDLGYRGYLDDRVQTRIVNLANTQDTVTGKVWELNHELFKPTVHVTGLTRIEYWFFSHPAEVRLKTFWGTVELNGRTVNDPHESMAMAVKSRSRSIAHGVDVRGKVDEIVDLHETFGFGDEHGSQWERSIQDGPLRYFQRIVDETR